MGRAERRRAQKCEQKAKITKVSLSRVYDIKESS